MVTVQKSLTEKHAADAIAAEPSYKLVSGTYSPEETKDIMLHLINSKIHHHQMKCFSCEERLGSTDQHSVNRIIELSEMRKAVLALIEEAQKTGKQLSVSASVEITME